MFYVIGPFGRRAPMDGVRRSSACQNGQGYAANLWNTSGHHDSWRGGVGQNRGLVSVSSPPWRHGGTELNFRFLRFSQLIVQRGGVKTQHSDRTEDSYSWSCLGRQRFLGRNGHEIMF